MSLRLRSSRDNFFAITTDSSDGNELKLKVEDIEDEGKKMAALIERVSYLDEVAEFLATRLAVEDVLAFHPSAEVEARFDDLLESQ